MNGPLKNLAQVTFEVRTVLGGSNSVKIDSKCFFLQADFYPITGDDLIKVNEQQELFHDAVSGVFTLSFEGQTTAAIIHNEKALDLQAKLEALSTIGTGNVSVSGQGNSNSPWTVTFQADLGQQNVPDISGNFANLKKQNGDVADVTILTTVDPSESFSFATESQGPLVLIVDPSDSRITTGDAEVWAQTVVLNPTTGRVVNDTIQTRGVQATNDDGDLLYVESFSGGQLTTTTGAVHAPAMKLNGEATQRAFRIRLTDNLPPKAIGSAFTQDPVEFAADYSFSARIDLDIHSPMGMSTEPNGDGDGPGGDWNGDGFFDSQDLLEAFIRGGFVRSKGKDGAHNPNADDLASTRENESGWAAAVDGVFDRKKKSKAFVR